MKRLILLLSLSFVIGCDQTDKEKPQTTSKETSRSRTDEPVKKTAEKEQPPTKEKSPAQAGEATNPPRKEEEEKEVPPEEAPPIPAEYKPLNKTKTIFFENPKEGPRRIHLLASVCLREGPLEVFLCKFQSKEHESVLNLDADGREIHFALMAAGAKPGSPVKFQPRFQAATGDKIKVTLTYREKGKVVTCPAQEWVKDTSTKKPMTQHWVFAGSRFFKDPDNPNRPDFYMANNGEFISLSNFPDSMLDLPVKSSKDAAELQFEIITAKVPPLRTPVLVTLELVPANK